MITHSDDRFVLSEDGYVCLRSICLTSFLSFSALVTKIPQVTWLFVYKQ